jgi:hypothetical protein
MILKALQDAEQCAGLARMRGDRAVRKTLLIKRERG